MPPATLPLNNLRSFRLGTEGHSVASTPLPSPQPTDPGPYDGLSEQEIPTSQLVISQGRLATDKPTPAPPFRLLPPSVPGSRMPSPRPEPSRPPSPSMMPMAEAYAPASISVPHRRTPAVDEESRRLQRELRSRPLHESVYGRQIVSLLTMQWVIVPSGMAATVFPLGTDERYVEDCAHYINLLVCGTEAFRYGPAGVLALYSIMQLNRLLVRSGLSPIAPLPAPPNWGPLAARTPPDFLLDGFTLRPGHPISSEDAE